MMFGDSHIEEEIAENMLRDFELEDILDMNDLTHLDVLSFLIKGGLIGNPEGYTDILEGSSEEPS